VEKRLQEYTLVFSSLKDGDHQFSFNLDKSFFDCFEHSLIESGDIQIDMDLKKSETMLVANFTVQGTVDSLCYRCNDPLEFDIEGNFRLVFKFGLEESDNEELIVLPHEAYQLELANHFYEFVHVLLPNRIVHEEGDCNEDMVAIMKQYLID
jgi:uncharacterized metal-binding protein YceD (DUF177 family)